MIQLKDTCICIDFNTLSSSCANAHSPTIHQHSIIRLLEPCQSHGRKGYPDVPLICLFLISEVGHLLMCHLSSLFCRPSVKNGLCLFLMDYKPFPYWFLRIFYILRKSALDLWCRLQLFFQPVTCALGGFAMKNLWAYMLDLSIFSSNADCFTFFLERIYPLWDYF